MSLMRVKFTREDPVRGLLHREFLQLIQRSIQAARLPVATTDGAEPRPVCAAGLPLAAGHLSRCEYVDFVVCLPITATEFGRRLAAELPEGIRNTWQRRLGNQTLSLKAAIRGFRYRVSGIVDPARAEAYNAATAWPLTQIRKGRERVLDLKRNVRWLQVEPNRVIFDIEVREEGMPKPEEVIASVFGMTLEEATALTTERAAARFASNRPARQPAWE
ncbi:MAG: TIGR03936 family radical SAM-associated protein [FCB group bacterium]|jgi:radical SAM-linked protein|nr:TIGR03936 family radical SAM-associated protein [FCB group bacterium]